MVTDSTKQKFKVTYLAVGACIALMLGSYCYGTWMQARSAEQKRPRLALDSLLKGLREFKSKNGGFPVDLVALDKVVWKHNPPADFGPDNRRLTAANYYYLYNWVDGNVCTVWAIPCGETRTEGATIFAIISAKTIRVWKGPSLIPEDLSKLTPQPDAALLALLGMTEQKLGDQH
jgi:hypothetical protein